MPRLLKMPLVEAVLEVYWQFPSQSGKSDSVFAGQPDPDYSILAGRFFDKIRKNFPYFEAAPQGAAPPNVVFVNTVQYRFRKNVGGWPLVQLGPGVATCNHTAPEYEWAPFREVCVETINTLFASHPAPENFHLGRISLQYIDAIPFDFEKQNILAYLKEKFQIDIAFKTDLFHSEQIKPSPYQIGFQSNYACRDPLGMVVVTFQRGEKDGLPHLFWQTTFVSQGKHIPTKLEDFPNWLEKAHEILVKRIFWPMIDSGGLKEEFGFEE